MNWLGKTLGGFGVKQEAPKPKAIDVKIYRLKDNVHPTSAEVMQMMLCLIHNTPIHWGVKIPSFPFVTERQYESLPANLQKFFNPQVTSVSTKSD